MLKNRKSWFSKNYCPQCKRHGGSYIAVGVGDRPVAYLSRREYQVFQMCADAVRTTDIAKRMHLSPKSVSTYIYRLREKFSPDIRYVISSLELRALATTWRLQEGETVDINDLPAPEEMEES